ncbi:MAG: helix-turn-helix domain-containing protein [bacterium]
MIDIKDALNSYYNSNLSLRKASMTTGVPKSTLSDYIKRIDTADILCGSVNLSLGCLIITISV